MKKSWNLFAHNIRKKKQKEIERERERERERSKFSYKVVIGVWVVHGKQPTASFLNKIIFFHLPKT